MPSSSNKKRAAPSSQQTSSSTNSKRAATTANVSKGRGKSKGMGGKKSGSCWDQIAARRKHLQKNQGPLVHPCLGGGLVLRRLCLKMSTRGASRLFTGIRLDDDDEVEEVLPSTQRPPIAASDGTSGSSHVFSTPNSHATTQVGDGDGNRDLSKVGLFFVRDVDEICGGIVGKVDGNGGGAVRFCTRSVDECRYSTHRENKALIEDQTYYINTPRAHTARLHPSLSMMCLQVPTEDDDNDLENRLQPMDVWVTYINAINVHEALNLAGSLAAKEGTRQTFVVTGMEEEDVDSNITPTDSTWIRVFAPSLSTFVRDIILPEKNLKSRVIALLGFSC
jgi:hypothetical protein